MGFYYSEIFPSVSRSIRRLAAYRDIQGQHCANTSKSIGTDTRRRHCLAIDTCQAATTVECEVFNRRHTVGNRDACQVAAILECGVSDLCHAVGNRDACQVPATGECPVPDRRHTAGNRDACQPDAIGECAHLN